jgi:uncharacterized protein
MDAPTAITSPLVSRVMAGYRLPPGSVHGPAHWRRVRANGLALAALTPGADAVVVELFALLHDSRRINDYDDPEHGPRAATLVRVLTGAALLTLDEARLDLLADACARHTLGDVSADPTLGCCWDADRLELARLQIRPRDRFLSTAAARDPAVQHTAWTHGSTGAVLPAGPDWPLPEPERRRR